MTIKPDEIGITVLEFYRELPFNITGDPKSMAAEIRKRNSTEEYPPLLHLVHPGKRVLDVGCGAGWLANTLSYHQRATVDGVDFNPVALKFAASVAKELGVETRFLQADLLKFVPEVPYDVVTSIGVLHCTHDCHAAVDHVCRKMVRPGGYVFIGLYHLYGRRPFLDHFAKLKAQGCSEEEMYQRYKAMFGNQSIDETHVRSWFRDQVIHPFETQHTLAEMLPVLKDANMELVASSFNDYKQRTPIDEVLALEPGLEIVAKEHLAAGRFHTGFFCFLAKRRV